MSNASDHRDAFIRLAIAHQVLRFGEFTLKSGRTSPYFFNAGHFATAAATDGVGQAYAAAIREHGFEFDVLFGPAYKGIPLAVTTGVALQRDFGADCGIAYNRKETKDHGEGGNLVGAPLTGRVLLIDDVITAGTAIREVLPLIEGAGGRLVGILTAVDRQERGQGERSAVQELEAELSIPVRSIITLGDLVTWLESEGRSAELEAVRAYRDAWGVAG